MSVAAREQAPVVSHDSNSPEAKIARQSATLEYQSKSDAIYDTVIERFENKQSQTKILSGIAVFVGIVLLASLISPHFRK